MKSGIELIAAERREQNEKHNRTIEKDVIENGNEQLSMGALMLLSVDYEEGIDNESYPDGWDKDICAKMISKSYKERLIIAAALIAAEIDRLQAIEKSEMDNEVSEYQKRANFIQRQIDDDIDG